ncbi:MAG: GH39 family glycosyl hydrolase [Saccharofermentanales bacterium]
MMTFETKLDCLNKNRKVRNIFNHCGKWYGGGLRGSQWAGLPQNSLKNKFPFVEFDTMHTATGGTKSRDLYNDPDDPAKGMNFTNLNVEIDRILYQGILPYIKIGSVPNCLSDDALNGEFCVNNRPPTTENQWMLYYDYVSAIAQNVVDIYGLDAARTWQWGCFSEGNNVGWFQTSDKNAENTKNAFFKLYDYTTAALQSVLGENKFYMGTHLLGCLPMEYFDFVSWDELDFIDHCSLGKNYFTGDIGTQLNFVSGSHYDNSPGDKGNVRSLTETADRMRRKALEGGLKINIGIDEYGQIADPDGIELCGTRTIGASWETSKTAADYFEILNADYDYISIWALTSAHSEGNRKKDEQRNGVPGARLNQANTAELTYKMSGSILQNTDKTGDPNNANDDVEMLVSYDDEKHTVYAFAYNHNESLSAVGSEDIMIKISNIGVYDGEKVIISRYFLDSEHSNWYNVWWKERGSKAAIAYSPYDVAYPSLLKDQEDIDFWNDNESRYVSISDIEAPVQTRITPENNSISLNTSLTHHSVVLYEISNSKIV